MKVLFLYTELAGYFSNCIEVLYKIHRPDITLVHYPPAANAPIQVEMPGINLVCKQEISTKELHALCLSFAPDIVYVAGWMDKDYKKIARLLKIRGAIIICGIDNVWKGTLRQRMACILADFLIKPFFTHLWVAGHRQHQFARRLGYSNENILTGLYMADVDKFRSISRSPHKRKLVYVGRIEHIKGIQQLYTVFYSLSENERNGWTLDIIGNGSLKESMNPSTTIRIHDFMQPKELITYVTDAGGFILPSLEEPWGVVVQEFAAAGKPLLLSSAVNSGENYLIDGYNGYRFKCGNTKDLKAKLVQFFSLDDETRFTMGGRSAEMALLGEPKNWVANLLSSTT